MVKLLFRARVGEYEETARTASQLHAGVIVFGQWLAINDIGSTELATGTAVSCVSVAVLSASNAYANKEGRCSRRDPPPRLITTPNFRLLKRVGVIDAGVLNQPTVVAG